MAYLLIYVYIASLEEVVCLNVVFFNRFICSILIGLNSIPVAMCKHKASAKSRIMRYLRMLY